MHLIVSKTSASNPARANKLVTAAEALRLIHDGDTVATGGFVGIGFAEGIAVALKERFIATQVETGLGAPRRLTLVYAAGQGDGEEPGLSHFSHAGLVEHVSGGHWDLVPKLQAPATSGAIDSYNLPQGVITHLLREIAAGKLGTLSRIAPELPSSTRATAAARSTPRPPKRWCGEPARGSAGRARRRSRQP